MFAGGEPAGGLLEVRYRKPCGMGQHFYPCDERQGIAGGDQDLGRRADCFVGAAPRRRRRGRADAIERTWTLWADIDTSEAVEALERSTRHRP